jgi:hypothetical protein
MQYAENNLKIRQIYIPRAPLKDLRETAVHRITAYVSKSEHT